MLLSNVQPVQSAQITVSQGLLLGIAFVLLFAVSIFATGLTAKKLVFPGVTYTEALWATVFKNLGMSAGLAVFAGYLKLPPVWCCCRSASSSRWASISVSFRRPSLRLHWSGLPFSLLRRSWPWSSLFPP